MMNWFLQPLQPWAQLPWLTMCPLEILATIFGLWSVACYVRESVWAWPTGLINVLLFIVLFYHWGLFAETGGIYAKLDPTADAGPRLSHHARSLRERIEQPCLFIGGDRDPATTLFGAVPDPVAMMRIFAPRVEGHVLKGVGHWTQQEKPAEFNAALLGFLRSL